MEFMQMLLLICYEVYMKVIWISHDYHNEEGHSIVLYWSSHEFYMNITATPPISDAIHIKSMRMFLCFIKCSYEYVSDISHEFNQNLVWALN